MILCIACAAPQEQSTGPAVPTGGDFDTLVGLFLEFRVLHEPIMTDGVPDYSHDTIARTYAELRGMQERLAAFDIDAWPVTQQIDYHLVRAEMNGMEFVHRVMKPWTTDPYVYWGSSTSTSLPYYGFSDRPAVPEGPGWGEPGFKGQPDFPLSDEEIAAYGMRLRALPQVLAQGKTNVVVSEAKYDMALITLRALAVEGGLLEAMVESMREHHPDLLADTEAAWAAVQDYTTWIEDNLDQMTAPTGVGKDNFSWWLKNVWLIPYTYEEAATIARREYERGLTALKMVEYRNRDLPPLEPAQTREEYVSRHHDAEDHLREFLLTGQFFTVTADELDRAYAAYPPRPPASPASRPGDYLGAIIHEHLGHQLDAIRPETDMSPIRAARRLHEMTHARREGVADGMGTMLMQAGIYAELPGMMEIMIMKAANSGIRGLGDLKFQSNELDYEGWNRYDAAMSVYGSTTLDESEWYNAGANYNTWDHKKDAVQAPGYEMAYVTGIVQFDKALTDRAAQLGDEFVLREFMDEFFSVGQIPLALIRWQMTGLTDEMEFLLEGLD